MSDHTALTGPPPPLRDLRGVLLSLIDPRGPKLAKLSVLCGVAYLVLPLDLIPDRTPYVGHLDEVFALLLGLLGARLLTPEATAAAAPVPAPLGRAWRESRAAAARAGVAVFAGALARPVLRLMLGRWPDAAELARFRLGLRENGAALPPLMRAIARVPAARGLVNRTMLLAAAESGPAAPGIVVATDGARMLGDPMRIWRGPPVSFLHLEKTAGSSLTTVLAAQFHPTQIDPDPNRVIAPDDPLLRARGGHRPDGEKALVWGHYDLATLRALGTGRVLVTVLREPRARILSLYHYFRANEGDGERRVQLAHELDLAAYLRCADPDCVNMVDNLYVRRLTGFYAGADGRDPLRADPDAALARAIEALDMFDVVGLAEDMDATLATLGRRLGFVPPRRAPRVNALAANEANPFVPFRTVPRAPVTAEIDRELDRLTGLDRVLYERAVRRVQDLLPG